jgi:uncharacterized protein (TIGR02001 family)
MANTISLKTYTYFLTKTHILDLLFLLRYSMSKTSTSGLINELWRDNMKSMKTLLGASVAAAVLSTTAMAEETASGVDVSASVSIASAYFWRGQDLGNGSPAVSGDLVASAAGAYGGIWGSSGDDASGNEFDLFAGYGAEIEGVSLDLSVWTYVYPDGGASNDTFADLSEVILSVGYGPVSVTYYDNIAGASGYTYLTVGAGYEEFSATYGMTSNNNSDDDYGHLDLGYAYNDNLSFTLSKVIDQDVNQGVDNDLNFVVSYSVPIK